MDQNTWEQIDPQLDEIAEELKRLLESPEAEKLRTLLATFSHSIPQNHSATLTCILDVFDPDRDKSLPLLRIGLGVTDLGEVYPTTGDSAVHRYIVNGEIEVVPNDRCPKCLGEWDFKMDHVNCSNCDAQLGVNCWVLLDSDVCPYCEKGEVSARSPHCKECGYSVDPKFVKWG